EQGADAVPEAVERVRNDGDRDLVPGSCGVDDLARTGCGTSGPLGIAPSDGGGRRNRLQAADRATPALQRMPDVDVADFPGEPVRAMDPPAEHQRGRDPGADRDERGLRAALTGADAELGEPARGDVVPESHRPPEPGLEDFAERDLTPVQVRREMADADL